MVIRGWVQWWADRPLVMLWRCTADWRQGLLKLSVRRSLSDGVECVGSFTPKGLLFHPFVDEKWEIRRFRGSVISHLRYVLDIGICLVGYASTWCVSDTCDVMSIVL